MSTAKREITLEAALAGVSPPFRERLLKSYKGLKTAQLNGDYDTCGLRVGRFCEVVLRWAQNQVVGHHTPFGSKISNFKFECDQLEKSPKDSAHESVRILIPRGISFLYTLRNKRGIGHEGGDVDANEIDAAAAVRLADWCVCEIIRLHLSIPLEDAQAICDVIAERQVPQIWDVFGRRRVLDVSLSYAQQTLLLLYSSHDAAIPIEELAQWIEHPKTSHFRRDVLCRLHKHRLIEYDRDTETAAISPLGAVKVEQEIIPRHHAER